MTTEMVISKAYKILDNVTPLKNDCGKLCDGECCKGDTDTGMILFPGEENLFKNNSNFTVKAEASGYKLLICNGKCNREERPLSCRIFPLFPLLCDGKIYVIDDPRARGICPLLYDEIRLNKSFERKVGKIGRLLVKNEETSDFLLHLSDNICDIITLTQDLFGRKD